MCVSVETYQPQADNVQRVIIQGRGKLKFKQSRDAFMSGFTASHLNELSLSTSPPGGNGLMLSPPHPPTGLSCE